MSPKAFKLVDELRSSPKPHTSSKEKPSPAGQETIAARAVSGNLECFLESAASDQSGVRITAVTPMEGGEWVSVTLAEGKERRYVRLLTEQYASLRPAVGPASAELVEALDQAGTLCDAIRKGMELLGYGAMSRRRLSQKLSVRGFEKETVGLAVEYLEHHGFLSEGDDAVRFAEQDVRKMWGPRRIREDLFARGFPSEVIFMAMESLEDVDFAENCRRVIDKKYGGVPRNPAEIKKMVAALMRLGYTSEHIREAMRR